MCVLFWQAKKYFIQFSYNYTFLAPFVYFCNNNNKKFRSGINVSSTLHYWIFSNKRSYQTHHKAAGPSWMHTNLPFFTPRRSCVTLNRRTKLQWCLMWVWFYANDTLLCFPDVCPITASMEEGAVRPGTPSAAPVITSGTPELPVTHVRTVRKVSLFQSLVWSVYPKQLTQF